jgi:hypothetical protein
VLGTPTPASWVDAIRVNSLPTRRPKDLRPTPKRVVEKATPQAGTAGSTDTGQATGAGGSTTNQATGGAAPGTTR